jgi:hypothetical protein
MAGLLFLPGWLSVRSAPGVGSPAPSYILRDAFQTNEAGPIASPRTCSPGPGTLTAVQTHGNFSVAAQKLVIPNSSSATGSGCYLRSALVARQAGRAFFAEFSVDGSVATATPGIGWFNADNVSTAAYEAAFDVSSLALNVRTPTTTTANVLTLVAAANYRLGVILRSSGAFYVSSDDDGLTWKLLWVGTAGSNSFTNTGVLSCGNSPGKSDRWVVADLPYPWNSDYSLATSRVAGSVAASQAFTHTANGLIEWTQTTVPSASSLFIDFKRNAFNNKFQVSINSSGDLRLTEFTAPSTQTQRALASAVVANGHRVVLIFEGATIRAFSNNVLRWTYSSATNFQTETAGVVAGLGTGGAIADLIAWPRDVSSHILRV